MFKLTHICSIVALSLFGMVAGCVAEAPDSTDGQDADDSEDAQEASSALVVLGGSCQTNSDCYSGYCKAVPGGIRGDITRVCAAKVSNGFSCQSDAGCYSGNCVNGTCQPN